jgi:hypothetical protein
LISCIIGIMKSFDRSRIIFQYWRACILAYDNNALGGIFGMYRRVRYKVEVLRENANL